MNYDSAGLMAQIQALIAPPTTSRSRTNNNKHPYFKRPGRGHNHDTCDACHEAGDLLCCDSCSASFHLMCVNPPLDYEQIPAGDWRCHRCLSTQGDSGGDGEGNKKILPMNRRTGKKRAAPPLPKEPPTKKPLLTVQLNTRITAKGGNVVSNFFSQAVEFARKMNPEQFVLPKYLMEYGASQFPGAPRPPAKKGSSKASKQIIETENGMVPSPVVICFVCDVSCRRSPMIKCDACSAAFHFECLNPPLTGVPQGRWLCHLHPESTLEHKTLKSLSFTERVRLYDYAKQPIDPIQVALKFVTKTQRAKYSYFRSKVKIRGKELTQIPAPIVACYMNEEEDDDTLGEWPEVNKLPVYNTWNNVQMDGYSQTCSHNDELTGLDILANVATTEFDKPDSKQQAKCNKGTNTEVNNALSSPGFANQTNTSTVTESEQTKLSTSKSDEEAKLEALFQEKYKTHAGGILHGLDFETILILAAQKVKELRCNETIENKENGSVTDKARAISQPSVSADPAMANGNDDIISEKSITEPTVLQPEPHANAFNKKIQEVQNTPCRDTQVEISVPYIKLLIVNLQKEMLFKEGEIMIGKGHVALDVTEFVPCSSVTDEHCCIYYDYVGSRWELINYSPNGTLVNKVLYGCEPAGKISKNISFMDNLHGTRGVRYSIQEDLDSLEMERKCHCRLSCRLQPRESLDISAHLEIGSRIQIGCVRIVVVDSGCGSKWVPKKWLVYNGVSQIPVGNKKNVKEESVDGICDENSNSGSENEVKDTDSDVPEKEVVPAKVRRKSFTKTISTRGGTRGRGRGRGRGITTRKRVDSVQNNVKNLPRKKFSTRGRKRKLVNTRHSEVAHTNGDINSIKSLAREDGTSDSEEAGDDRRDSIVTRTSEIEVPASTKNFKEDLHVEDKLTECKTFVAEEVLNDLA